MRSQSPLCSPFSPDSDDVWAISEVLEEKKIEKPRLKTQAAARTLWFINGGGYGQGESVRPWVLSFEHCFL